LSQDDKGRPVLLERPEPVSLDMITPLRDESDTSLDIPSFMSTL